MKYNWVSLIGKFVQDEEIIRFGGGTVDYEGSPYPAIGTYICDQQFSGGTISADIKFSSIDDDSTCEIIANFDPALRSLLNVGIGGGTMYAIRHFGNTWTNLVSIGDRSNMEPNRSYKVCVELSGSRLSLSVDNVQVAVATVPLFLPQGQVGIWTRGRSDIEISNYHVIAERPKIFVIMQFSSPYNEIYRNVLKIVCDDLNLQAIRADETTGPGLIIADVEREIIESRAVIAEITPANPNVFYEVGFAHAINKPTILLAEKGTQLPFDVSPFRVLFYENSISGKGALEEGLRNHLSAVLHAV